MDMKHKVGKAKWLALALGVPWWAPHAEVKVERSPLEIGTAIDIGQVVKGVDMITGATPKDFEGMMIQRTAVYLNQSTTVNDRLVIKVGVGGLFFYGYPEIRSSAQIGRAHV